MRTVVQAVSTDESVDVELARPLVGHVVEVVDDGCVMVRIPVVGCELLTATCVEHVAERPGGLSSLIGSRVLVMCANGDSGQAIVCGVLDHGRRPPVNQLAEARLPSMERTTLVDGVRVVLEAAEEIVLQCGKSSLTLTADGRIVMRGVELVSRASRTNKIKGATVNIN